MSFELLPLSSQGKGLHTQSTPTSGLCRSSSLWLDPVSHSFNPDAVVPETAPPLPWGAVLLLGTQLQSCQVMHTFPAHFWPAGTWDNCILQ